MTSTPQEKRAYENLLCDAVMALSRKGVHDPNVREILAQLNNHPRSWPESDGHIIETRKKLPGLKKKLEKQANISIALLSGKYYGRYRDQPPTNRTEAAQCITNGRAAQGLWILNGRPRNPIWQAWLSMNINNGVGKVSKGLHGIDKALDEGHLDRGEAAELVQDIKSHPTKAVQPVLDLTYVDWGTKELPAPDEPDVLE